MFRRSLASLLMAIIATLSIPVASATASTDASWSTKTYHIGGKKLGCKKTDNKFYVVSLKFGSGTSVKVGRADWKTSTGTEREPSFVESKRTYSTHVIYDGGSLKSVSLTLEYRGPAPNQMSITGKCLSAI